ncbi:MAG: Hpt domain-containing protein, partial [Pirellulales bacterium]|nr:Hpt domain-containing protein [Pirellulales bacterium]
MSDNRIMVSVDPDLEDLVPGFLENRASDREKLAQSLADKNFPEIQSIGHNLKGVGGGYGFEAMSEIGANIETAAKTQDTEALTSLIDQFADYLDRV